MGYYKEKAMRKLLILISMISLMFLTACQSVDPAILETDIDANTYVELTVPLLEAKIDSGADFILYISSVTCTSCADFKPILESVIASKKVVVNKIEADLDFKTTNTLVPYEFTPTIVVFKNGVIIGQINAVDDAKYFASETAFLKFYDKYITIAETGKTDYLNK